MLTQDSSDTAYLPPARIENEVQDLKLTEIDGEPRARDLDIAKRLGFPRLSSIRVLIERHLSELASYGTLHRSDAKSSGGRPGKDYWLNEEQALLIALRSDAENAPAVRAMVIRVFVAWRRGHLEPRFKSSTNSREVQRFWKFSLETLAMVGIEGNQAAIAANRALKVVTGFDMLNALGVSNMVSPVQDNLVNATVLGQRLGLSAIGLNQLLEHEGYQQRSSGSKKRVIWRPTDKGKAAGATMTEIARSNGTGQAQQLLWPLGLADALGPLLSAGVA